MILNTYWRRPITTKLVLLTTRSDKPSTAFGIILYTNLLLQRTDNNYAMMVEKVKLWIGLIIMLYSF